MLKECGVELLGTSSRSIERAEDRELFRDISNALRNISEEWAYIVDHFFVPKCELTGYCPEKKSCGRRPKKEED